jgi:hypothetical protein
LQRSSYHALVKSLLHKSLRELAAMSQLSAASSTLTSALLARCEALLDTPLQNYSIEDLRLLVGQQLGLHWLMPLALAHLTHNLFSEGDYYAGDLLASVLRLENDYWQAHPAECTAFKAALAAQLPLAGSHNLPRALLKQAHQRLAELRELT